jgi:AAA15 family ATPase/GTPase
MDNKTSPLHLVEFNISNYRSIRDRSTLSLISTTSHNKNNDFPISTIKKNLLRSAALYGPNASGKSNVIRALFVYRNILVGDIPLFKQEAIEPFLLDEMSKTRVSEFETMFEYKNRIFLYGFSVMASEETITAEWLRVSKPKEKRLVTIYERDRNKIQVNKNLLVSEHGISRKFIVQLQTKELFATTLSKNPAWTLAKDVVEAWGNCQVSNTLVHNPYRYIAEAIHESAHL